MKQAIGAYIVGKGLDSKNKYPKPGVKTCLALIPWLESYDSKWASLTKDNFNPNKHDAHKHLEDIVRNVLKSESQISKLVDEEKLARLEDEEGGESDSEEEEREADKKEADGDDDDVRVRSGDTRSDVVKSGPITPKKGKHLADRVLVGQKRNRLEIQVPQDEDPTSEEKKR